MASTIRFTPNLRRHVACESIEARGATVRELLDDAFRRDPRARGYVLDEQGGLRPHVAVFVDGELIADRRGLGDAVRDGADVWVMQALSGG